MANEWVASEMGGGNGQELAWIRKSAFSETSNLFVNKIVCEVWHWQGEPTTNPYKIWISEILEQSEEDPPTLLYETEVTVVPSTGFSEWYGNVVVDNLNITVGAGLAVQLGPSENPGSSYKAAYTIFGSVINTE